MKSDKKFGFFGLRYIVEDHKGYGRQIFLLSKNELKKQYKGSLLGPLWAIVKPVFTLFILWFAFTVGIRGSGRINGFPQFMFLLTGYVPWFYISESILGGSRSLRKNSQFVTKISFPVSNIMTFTALSRLYVHIFLALLMYVVLVIFGYCPNIYNFQVLYYLPLMFMFFLALSWTTACFSAVSKDFENLVNSIMTGLFWLSGVLWDTYGVHNDWVRRLMYLNPINYFVNGYRKTFLYEEFIFDRVWENIIFFGEFAVIILLGAHYYKKLRKTLPDIL